MRWTRLAAAAILAAGSFAVPMTRPSADASVPPVASAVDVVAEPSADVVAATASVRIPGDLGWISSNWAGYAVNSGPYTSVSGQWTVPTLTASRRDGYSAMWVGIDGFDNASLIQAGTEADYYGGAAHYSAWWEILPASAETVPTLSVRAGDTITVSIARVSSGRWRIAIKDSRGGSYSTTRSYAGAGTSAEWIEEAPLIGRHATQLAHHASVRFRDVAANGVNPRLAVADGGAMIRHGVVANAPSLPDARGNGFALAQ